MAKVETVMVMVTAIAALLTPNKQGQLRKNIRLAERIQRKLMKRLKKGGLTEEESLQIKEMNNSLVQAYKRLLKI